ncbi:hypothetical protein GCM10027172_03980 [Halomonas garicola]
MPRYSFKIDPCPPEEGYGWVLRYFEDDWEIPGYEGAISSSKCNTLSISYHDL